MTEKQTSSPEPRKNTSHSESGEVVSQADIDQFNEWAAASSAAQRILEDAPTPEIVTESVYRVPEQRQNERQADPAPRHDVSPRVRRNRIVAGATAGAALAGGLYIANEASETNENSDPSLFSEQTTVYTLQPGDAEYVAVQHIEGIESIDSRDAIDHIKSDPANLDVLQDGLQPGEQLIIPTHVKGFEDPDN